MIFNTLKRSCAAFGALIAPRSWQVLDNGSQRRMCSKPQDSVSRPNTNQPAPGYQGFKVPGYKPSDFDKKVLIWSGRFKTKEEIPELISFEIVDAARNRVRVKACYVMIAMTVVSCMAMVYLGKQAAGRHESLTRWNMEKKAQWREEAQREREASASVTIANEKAQ